MMDISARELKGHNILAVERFWDNTRWMIEFSVLRPSTAYGSPGEEMRLFLTEDGYQAALQSQQRREIKIKRYARVIEGHILDFKPGKRRRVMHTLPFAQEEPFRNNAEEQSQDSLYPGFRCNTALVAAYLHHESALCGR